ncbi:LysR family transcriptional regulator [Rhodobium gokarnense]|uniref:DNA-binding transcriptional LysR family regulator n=1 Tax=Rhodobium gokarnense TaxID=364296 RepID=A0ABT3HAW1_9HYPH|nr:LysR family transcriptional regulator [Rhodobium gokarnense]MCW2307469.1 DNA-binding transcriptional LysR family regulator [Rhodobium gokarnense]
MDIAAALRAFIRTVERGSVTAAARDLGVSQPGVTKHLRNLERHVGARLLERSARIVRTTPEGQALYDTSREALATIEAALEGVRRDMGAVEGNLRVHAPSCLGAKHLHGIVMAFQRRHPDVTADLVLDNRDVDLVYENFDLAIKYGRPVDQDLIIRRLGSVRRILVASPDFLDRFGPIDTVERLSEVGIITNAALLASRDVLPLRHRDGGLVDVPVRAVLRTNNADVIAATLIKGHAAGPVQQLLVNDELAGGRLVRILPDYEVRPTEAFLAYPSVRFMRPVVRAFTDFAVPALRSVDGIVGTGERLSSEECPQSSMAARTTADA